MPKITALTAVTTMSTDDILPIVDLAGPTTNKITVDNFRIALMSGSGMTATPLDRITTADFDGAVTMGTTLAVTGVATFTAIPVFSGGFTVTTGTSVITAGGLRITAGNLGINGAPSVNFGVDYAGTLISSSNLGAGIRTNPTFDSSTTSAGYGIIAGGKTIASAYTLTNQYSLFVYGTASAPKGAGSTVTNRYGIYVEAPTDGGTINYGIYVAGGTPAIYVAAGGVRLEGAGYSHGAAGFSYVSFYSAATLTGSSTQSGGNISATFDSGGTSAGRGLYVGVTTAAAAFIQTNHYGIYIDAVAKGAGSTITNRYGLFVVAPSDGGSTNTSIQAGCGALGVAVSGASVGTATTKYGFFSNVAFDTGTTSEGYGMSISGTATGTMTALYGLYIDPTTSAAAFTLSNLFGLRIASQAKGAGSTITNRYALYLTVPTDGGTLNVGAQIGTAAIPATAGAVAAGMPIRLYSNGVSIEWTTDAPTHTRVKGSLCFNINGSSTSTRGYVNTDGAGTWASFTTSA